MHIQDGQIYPSSSYSITIQKRDSLPNYILLKDDVIMGRRGEMGRCGLITKKEEGWFCGTGSLYLRPIKQKVYSVFLYYYLRSPIIKELLTGKATGTTMMNLNKTIISELPINLPSIEEQTQIVQEIETRLSVCDKLNEAIEQSLEKAQALRQSILKKAFEGKLLSQNELQTCRQQPDWEPAAKLLERVKNKKSK
jgi:type I restriction enzyme S subunit